MSPRRYGAIGCVGGLVLVVVAMCSAPGTPAPTASVAPSLPSAPVVSTSPTPTLEPTTPPATSVRRAPVAAKPQPTTRAPVKATAKPAPPPKPANTYYASCAAARAAGVAPLLVGEPGYRSGLDADHDGVACETGR